MTAHLRLIARQLAHLQRMREYLAYSTQRVQRILPIRAPLKIQISVIPAQAGIQMLLIY